MFVAGPPPGGPKCPLVVVLHGCMQTAGGYDAASGWSRLAEKHRFAVLYPEQRRANNDQSCFSWFRPADVARTGGEVESIRQMVATAITRFGADACRVYVVGLSAGGAMACAMLAAYPEVFVAGAVIAGLPFGAATGVSEAFDAMVGGRERDAKVWGALVRAAASGSVGEVYKGTWPRIAIWHGTGDRVVNPMNAGELVKQWTDVHGLGTTAPEEDAVGPALRRVWRDVAGRACVTDYTLPGLGHGAPVDDVAPPAPFFLPAGISSTARIATDFGLTETAKPPIKRLLSMVGLAAD